MSRLRPYARTFTTCVQDYAYDYVYYSDYLFMTMQIWKEYIEGLTLVHQSNLHDTLVQRALDVVEVVTHLIFDQTSTQCEQTLQNKCLRAHWKWTYGRIRPCRLQTYSDV